MIGSPTPGKLRERTARNLSKAGICLGAFEYTCGITPAGQSSPGEVRHLMRVKASVTQSVNLVDEARRLGLNMSRIVEADLRWEVAAERLRRQADWAGDR